MIRLHVRLLGKFEIWDDDKPVEAVEARKAQELLIYLLLFRDKPHRREALAEILWENCERSHARKYLRQALWQLQSALHCTDPDEDSLISAEDAEWLGLNSDVGLWLDVEQFERAYRQTQEIRGRQLPADAAEQIKAAVELYRGDLLEGWYQDWCLFERERLQLIYLTMLDKLIGYCEATEDYDQGSMYGTRILRCDRARERTHRRLMRLYYLAGRRTEALRQYNACAAALSEELGVEPAKSTKALRDQIRADRLPDRGGEDIISVVPAQNGNALTADEIARQLQQIQTTLAYLQVQVQQCMQALEETTGTD